MGELLDLSTLLDRPSVKLPDGKDCELRDPFELGAAETFRLRGLIGKVVEMASAAGTATAKDAERASGLLHELAGAIVVDCPEGLPDWVCVRIFQFWAERSGGVQALAGQRKRTPARKTRPSAKSPVAKAAAKRKPSSARKAASARR